MNNERIAKRLLRAAKEIIADISNADIDVDDIAENLHDSIRQGFLLDNSTAVELAADMVAETAKNLEAVQGNRQKIIARRVDIVGTVPSDEQIIEALIDKTGSSGSEIESRFDFERMVMDHAFNFVSGNLKFPSVVSTGRNGEYWGIPFGWDMLRVSRDWVRDRIKSLEIVDFEYADSVDDLDDDIVEEKVADSVYDVRDVMEVTDDTAKLMKDFDDEIDDVQEQLADIDYWANFVVENYFR